MIVDVGGFGDQVFCSTRTLQALPRPGEAATLSIETYVREDMIRLYGFANEPEREWFRLLQTVQGVGAKVALAVLGTLKPGELATAIALQDRATLARAPGVGRKVAERIAAEPATRRRLLERRSGRGSSPGRAGGSPRPGAGRRCGIGTDQSRLRPDLGERRGCRRRPLRRRCSDHGAAIRPRAEGAGAVSSDLPTQVRRRSAHKTSPRRFGQITRAALSLRFGSAVETREHLLVEGNVDPDGLAGRIQLDRRHQRCVGKVRGQFRVGADGVDIAHRRDGHALVDQERDMSGERFPPATQCFLERGTARDATRESPGKRSRTLPPCRGSALRWPPCRNSFACRSRALTTSTRPFGRCSGGCRIRDFADAHVDGDETASCFREIAVVTLPRALDPSLRCESPDQHPADVQSDVSDLMRPHQTVV